MKKIKLFTHTDLDGIGCAILGELAFGKNNIDVEYCNYDDINKKVKDLFFSYEVFEYDEIFITDISISLKLAHDINVCISGSGCFPEVKLIDHHPTALELDKYDWCNVKIEDEKEKTSGTRMFYDHLYFGDELDNIIRLDGLFEFVENIKKYDTWLWKTKYDNNTPKKLNDLLYIKGRERFISDVIKGFKTKGCYEFNKTDWLLLELEQEKIDKYIEKKNEQIIKRNILDYKAGVVFGEQYHSELGNKLAELNPHLDFIVIINPSYAISYRGIKNDINLGKDIAKVYGGGGHPKSAGSPIGDEVRDKILDILFN